jgi:hypothetical protein
MSFTALVLTMAAVILLATLAMLTIGDRLGRRHVTQGTEAPGGAVEGAVFGLLGLLIAFTFSGAISRFDSRRELVAQETNAIGTAWLRIDLVPEREQPNLRDLFRRYTDSRIATFRKISEGRRPDADAAEAARLQNQIWKAAVAACRSADSTTPGMLLLPALNEMIDITTTRAMAAQIHPPLIVFLMLGILALVSAFLAAYGMATAGKQYGFFHRIAFAAVIAATVYVIVDIEYPRLGLIRMDSADSILSDLRQTMR